MSEVALKQPEIDYSAEISESKAMTSVDSGLNGNGKTARAATAGSWKPGQSGNPNGRPKGLKDSITKDFITDLADIWKRRGMQVLETVAMKDPAKLLSAMVQLMPKEVLISGQESAAKWVISAAPELTQEEWEAKHDPDRGE